MFAYGRQEVALSAVIAASMLPIYVYAGDRDIPCTVFFIVIHAYIHYNMLVILRPEQEI